MQIYTIRSLRDRGDIMLKVSKRTLLLVAGIVWCLAGGNIAWLGIQELYR